MLRRCRDRSCEPLHVAGTRRGGRSRIGANKCGNTKPFHYPELIARIGAVLGRVARGRDRQVIRHADLAVNTLSREVTVGGIRIDLSAKEYQSATIGRAGESTSEAVVSRTRQDWHHDKPAPPSLGSNGRCARVPSSGV